MSRLILASASPRRRELLQQLGLDFYIQASNLAETIDPQLAPGPLVEALAAQKARDIAAQAKEGLVIGADTLVVQGETVLGKPENPEQAALMLRQLSGSTHQVLTGIAVIDAATGQEVISHEATTVRFRTLTDQEINKYIASGEPADKAGAYAIQGMGAIFVEGIEGCYFNVVGLPLARLTAILQDFDFYVL